MTNNKFGAVLLCSLSLGLLAACSDNTNDGSSSSSSSSSGGSSSSGSSSSGGSSSSSSGSSSGGSSSSGGTAALNMLLVSRSMYDPSFTLSGTLPIYYTSPITAVSPGTFPNVFTNDSDATANGSAVGDGNFGVTSEALIDVWPAGAEGPAAYLDLTQAAAATGFDFSTSFASKSELSLSVSQDGSAITFVGYNAPIDSIDRSNSNTPDVIDPTNSDTAPATYRTVGQITLATKALSFTKTDGYSGNNGRAAVLAGDGNYYIVGNAGNGAKNKGANLSPSGSTATVEVDDMLSMDTGVQRIAPGSSCALSTVIGTFVTKGTGETYTPFSGCSPTAGSLTNLGEITPLNTTLEKTADPLDQFGFSIAQDKADPDYTADSSGDKTGKDDNFRGLFLAADGTLYTTKGSGGNGVDSVFQVGAQGALANHGTLAPQNTAITIVPGFPVLGAANLSSTAGWSLAKGVAYPFNVWLPPSNLNLMFVTDEGDSGSTGADAASGSGGLWVYQNTGGTWAPIALVQTGLNLGTAYTVADTFGAYGTAGASYTTQPAGLRNLTGQVNGDGSFTLYAITSTIGNSLGTAFDAGADSNQLVTINVSVSGSTVTTQGFTVKQTAPFGQVLRGVALVPQS